MLRVMAMSYGKVVLPMLTITEFTNPFVAEWGVGPVGYVTDVRFTNGDEWYDVPLLQHINKASIDTVKFTVEVGDRLTRLWNSQFVWEMR